MARMSLPDALGWAVLLLGALVGSVIGGVAGFGAGITLVPLIAWVFGIRAVAPVLTITMLVGNLSRIWWSRHEIDRPVALRFLLGGVPATFVGAALYVGTSSEWLGWIIGGFLIAAVPLRRILLSRYFVIRRRHFPFLGAAIGVLSALVVTTGPVMTPFFLAYGLRRGAFIATEAVCTFGMHITRTVAFARYAVLTRETIAVGAVLGGVMFLGAWMARRLLDRMTDRVFLRLVEALLLAMGLQFLLFSR
jgi:uncharacterized membrane protein YfcA